MPDETPKPEAPPPSPTGTPVVPAALVKYLLPVVAVAGGLALAPSMGVDISFLHPAVPKWAALIAFIGMTLGIAGPGVRK